jgi:Right handed beta helix region/PASTA domain
MSRVGYAGFAASIAAACIVALASAAGMARAAGASWYVAPAPGGSDANSCSAPAAPCATINGAIGKAAAGDTILVAAGTYTGSGSEVVRVDKNLTLQGGWSLGFMSQTGLSTVDGESARVGVHVAGGAARIERFVVENGQGPEDGGPPSFSYAGGILVRGGSGLELDSSTVQNNRWGGIWSSAPVTVTNSTLSGNTGRLGSGGGITSDGALLTVTNSTISGNSANFGGGVLVLTASTVQLSNVTIVGNAATTGTSSEGGVGGGVRISESDSPLYLRNSIVAGNTAQNSGPDVSPDAPWIVSLGYNIATGFQLASTDIYTSDPRVDILDDNGGPTETRALLVDSPAVDGGNPGGCKDETDVALATDQRGVPRPQFAACDIGAFEADPPANDDFADATSLNGLPTPHSDSNEFATKESGEPDHAADAGGTSIWYAWTPTFTGMAFVSTLGSSFDTLVGAYSGSSVSSLATLAGNDDATLFTVTSKACFPVAADTPYRIAVDGFGAGQGDVALDWGQYADDEPCAILPPAISGTPQVGQTLTTTPGTWAGVPSSFAYLWIGCDSTGCSEIGGATAATYTLPPGTEGSQLFVRVTARHPTLDAIGYSALTAPVVAAPAPPQAPAPPLPPQPPPAPPASPPAPPRPAVRCRVPAVKGKHLRVARKRIVAARCRLGRVRLVRSRRAKGIVLAQRPRAGRKLPRGTRVNLVVSRGRKR